ncbi:unnamed protein product [Adineta ricciae]|uniref:Uncharacterized protein n=1 Tax=Adineta ricciae TaxID=249248 RepID=A0A815IMF7_ADIRI|nr:unnamed protein product [Adineta ricciae]CAF1384685.1 unnamed protein product [Adineta ricciae]
MDSAEKIVLGAAAIIVIIVVIVISVVYTVLQRQAQAALSSNDLTAYIYNQCTTNMQNPTLLLTLTNQDMFDYRQFSYSISSSVISTKLTLAFGFQHQTDFWGLDDIVAFDTYTKTSDSTNLDGSFESNNLTMSYSQCRLTTDKNNYPFLSQISWDFPHLGNCYYTDGTQSGLTYLIQSFPIVGGRTYDVSFWLQNNGNGQNLAVILVDA